MKIVINNTERIECGFKIGQQIMVKGSARQIEGLNDCIGNIRLLVKDCFEYEREEEKRKKKSKKKGK